MADQAQSAPRIVWSGRVIGEQGNHVDIYGKLPTLLEPKETQRMWHSFFRGLKWRGFLPKEDAEVIRAREQTERRNLQTMLKQAVEERDLLAEQVKELRARESAQVEENSRLWDLVNARTPVQ